MMRGKFGVALGLLLLAPAFGVPCFAQDPQAAATSALTDQLKAQYKPGAVLTVKKEGITAFPPGTDVTWVPASKYQDGQIHGPNMFASAMVSKNATPFRVGEKVNPTKVEVDVKKETVSISLTECDACNGVQQSSWKGKVNFQFPKGYLETADPGQVEDLIDQVLALDTGNNTGGQQQAQAQDNQGQQQAQQAPDGPPQSSAAVQLGQTPDQVVAILGQPDRITDPGGTVKVYKYKDIIILFTNDKVTRTVALSQPRQAQRPAEQTAPAAPPQPPAAIQLGQTPDQVVAILGQPDKIASVGTKKIYWYKDMKIIFINDKVTDVE